MLIAHLLCSAYSINPTLLNSFLVIISPWVQKTTCTPTCLKVKVPVSSVESNPLVRPLVDNTYFP